jgi:hypothetical protein
MSASLRRRLRSGVTALIYSALGVQLAAGGCNLSDINVSSSVTLDPREVIISLIRGAILTPIDNAITQGVNEALDQFVDEDE